ncbi:MAG: ATPase [Candidatus Lindowbacteria bacterium RIFCSPLOWO2_12_FULL_62_27]|nr:MAG: ATPase [Candidatus Lindowbacteria bacterium RIFCSPLOWO2_12_FULL_62_27]OGH62923.1 MAG: ATPase [Candidatus Lindowbacteria bacterium RIFCSPLOWO2_02_FULL_62_12]
MVVDVKGVESRIREKAAVLQRLVGEIDKVIVGQRMLVDRLLVGLLAGGHVLVEGVPGLAKTTAIKTVAAALKLDFRRIQFTPDLLPADLIGTLIFNPKTGEYSTRRGPVFANVILADEINRAPGKVQSALLEAMQERQVTIGTETFPLPDPFMVMATQNPIEQEGTYPLPEAQIDRFMLKVKVTYPSKDEEMTIMNRQTEFPPAPVVPVVTASDLAALRELAGEIYVDEKVKQYILDIVFATRDPKSFNLDLAPLISYGASPRATIYLNLAARAHAFIDGRGFVTPHDVKRIGMDVLRHRVIVSYEAEAEGMDSEAILGKIFDHVPVP